MKSEQLIESLSDYVNADDPFAVMIDGPWGSGKTYFIKETMIPRIHKEHKVVYFSVYGYSSLASLKSDLIGNLLISSLGKQPNEVDASKDVMDLIKGTVEGIGQKLTSFKSLAETTEKFIIKKQLRAQKDDANPVLIIDDLERVSREIHTSDLLGFLLTNIIEPYGYRVIIVGNIQGIRHKELKKFTLTREKLVSRTFPFTYDFRNVNQEFFQNSDVDFLKDDANWLLKMINEYVQHNDNPLNLRTLEFILTTFKMIDKQFHEYWTMHSSREPDHLQIRRSAFANLFVIATEYRKGRLTRENLTIIDPLLNTNVFFFPHIKDDEKKSMAEDITIRYHDSETLKKVIMYDSSVNEAVFNGVFRAEHFISMWMKLFNSRSHHSSLGRLANFRNLTDKQLKGLECQLIQESQVSEISINDILSSINMFIFFENNGLYFCNDKYLPKFLNALKNVANNTLSDNALLYNSDYIGSMYTALAKNTGALNQVTNILQSAELNQHKQKTEQLVNAIFVEDNTTVRKFDQSGFYTNVFREILNSDYLSKDILTSGSKAPLLNQYLDFEYIQISNSKDLHAGEISDISSFIQKINKFMEGSPKIDKIDKFNLTELRNTLTAIRTKFEN
ncbi:KAP family NTPase (plasmid) [Lacticaseibacillus paracasei]|uniref:P-loop NTPase fold protein n=1 Tax=Lacticaseibacillus paracasei TaxID=1597 RepID=UPI00272CD76A|nr:P-loop NTPase fold protein [Lacticaseibacillus paracasei]WKZ97553.1 KAP family NTPase [Lacticaseibacillus paracasei]